MSQLEKVGIMLGLTVAGVGVVDAWSLPAHGLGIVVGIAVGLAAAVPTDADVPVPGPVARLRASRPFTSPWLLRLAEEEQLFTRFFR